MLAILKVSQYLEQFCKDRNVPVPSCITLTEPRLACSQPQRLRTLLENILALGSFCTVVAVPRVLCSIRIVMTSDYIMIPQYGHRTLLQLLQKGYMIKKPTEGRQTVDFATIQLRHSVQPRIYLVRSHIK